MKQEARVMVQAVSCQLLRTYSNPRLVHVGFLGDRVTQEQHFFSQELRFPPMVHNHLLNYHRHYMMSAVDSNVNITHTGGGTKVMLPIFFRRYYNSSYNKFTYIMCSSFTKLRLFFHKVFSIINTLFPPLRETLYAGRAKLSDERRSSSRAPRFSPSSSGSPWSAPFRGTKKMEAEGC